MRRIQCQLLRPTDYLNSKTTPPENDIVMSSSDLTLELQNESRSEEKVAYSRFQKLLPILVVILLVIGLIAALLSSFILPNSSSSTGRNHQIVEVLITTGAATDRR